MTFASIKQFLAQLSEIIAPQTMQQAAFAAASIVAFSVFAAFVDIGPYAGHPDDLAINLALSTSLGLFLFYGVLTAQDARAAALARTRSTPGGYQDVTAPDDVEQRIENIRAANAGLSDEHPLIEAQYDNDATALATLRTLVLKVRKQLDLTVEANRGRITGNTTQLRRWYILCGRSILLTQWLGHPLVMAFPALKRMLTNYLAYLGVTEHDLRAVESGEASGVPIQPLEALSVIKDHPDDLVFPDGDPTLDDALTRLHSTVYRREDEETHHTDVGEADRSSARIESLANPEE